MVLIRDLGCGFLSLNFIDLNTKIKILLQIELLRK
jgi:hypothetical protein